MASHAFSLRGRTAAYKEGVQEQQLYVLASSPLHHLCCSHWPLGWVQALDGDCSPLTGDSDDAATSMGPSPNAADTNMVCMASETCCRNNYSAGTGTSTDMTPSSGKALLAGLICKGNIHLVVGANPLAAARCSQSLEAGAQPVIVAPACSELHYGLRSRIDEGSVRWEKKALSDDDLFRLGRPEVGHVVDAVFITSWSRDASTTHIAQLCKKSRIPVNVVDAPHLCTFTLLSVHADGPLQVGVTTNGHGCKLASRIRREIASRLPPGLGQACILLGRMRKRIQEDDCLAPGDMDESLDQSALFNKLIEEDDIRNRRMRWLIQVCEYWPLKKLAEIDDEAVDRLLTAYSTLGHRVSDKDLDKAPFGRLILAGSGPGHPSLLTRSTVRAIERADLILADKLVPAPVLELVPRRTPVHIARKFPGNADRAQEELLESALEGVRAGKTVLRLKQGDPFLYGRGGEELNWFRAKGFGDKVTVLPGMTSALSAPLFAGVPVTQRDVADQVLICTGTGKKGKPPKPPGYVANCTVVFLMALHRIGGLMRELTTHLNAAVDADAPLDFPTDESRVLWPPNTPCAVIERASCPDQRVIRTTLAHVAEAIEAVGSRPPGLLVVGKACEALYAPASQRPWVVEEGFHGLDNEEIDGEDCSVFFGESHAVDRVPGR